MATLLHPTERPVILCDVSWASYESLLSDGGDQRGSRMAYLDGVLEIMTPTFEHEHIKAVAQAIVETILRCAGRDYLCAGSTTFRREDVVRGFEADVSFYIANVARVRPLTRIDLTRDPPPDLVIEVDLTHGSLDKFPIYAALAVPEVWRFSGSQALIYELSDGDYVESERSATMPQLSAQQLTAFIQAGLRQPRPDLERDIETWTGGER